MNLKQKDINKFIYWRPNPFCDTNKICSTSCVFLQFYSTGKANKIFMFLATLKDSCVLIKGGNKNISWGTLTKCFCHTVLEFLSISSNFLFGRILNVIVIQWTVNDLYLNWAEPQHYNRTVESRGSELHLLVQIYLENILTGIYF